jgi:hypothetical protein
MSAVIVLGGSPFKAVEARGAGPGAAEHKRLRPAREQGRPQVARCVQLPGGLALGRAHERRAADGAPLAAGIGVVNGGPRLLSNGSPDITAYAEGFHWPENPEFSRQRGTFSPWL